MVIAINRGKCKLLTTECIQCLKDVLFSVTCSIGNTTCKPVNIPNFVNGDQLLFAERELLDIFCHR